MATDDTTDGSSADALKPGTALSDTYEIVRHLATGGMAEVYRARNIHTDEPVAIKVVLPAFAKDETITALFKKEATVLSRLHHDAIVHYHLFTIEKEMKRPYLVMEFVDGTALSDHLKRAPLDTRSTRTLISRVASGLAAAHALGVIHRDLSPDNVILPDDDVAKTKIIDFGIAKAAAVGKGTLLGDKFAGKYNYVSPEQLGLFGGEITGRSDMYSLGLIAAAALTGNALDMTGSGSHVDVIDKRREVPDLNHLDPAIRPVIAAMLQPKPADRPRDMQEVIDLLSGAMPLTTPPVTIPPAPTPGTGTVFGADMPSYPPTQQPPPPPANRAADPWKDPTKIHSQPSAPPQQDYGYQSQPPAYPQPGYGQSMPPQGYQQPGQSVPPGYGQSVPPQGFGQPGQSVPPGYGSMPPGGLTPAPPSSPQQPGQFSESPFGPYVETGEPKFKMPPPPKAPEKKRTRKKSGSPMGLILGAAAVVIIGGVGAVGFTQGWFGGSTKVPVPEIQPTAVASVTPSVSPTVAPTKVTPPATTVAVTPSVTPTVTGPATTTTPTTTTAAVTPTQTATPTQVVRPPATVVTPSVASLPTTTAPAAQILTAGDIAGWIDSYPLEDCAFASATLVARNSATIEAFGTSAAPFQAMASDFEEVHKFQPDFEVRELAPVQCPMADFLTSIRPLRQPSGPTLAVDTSFADGFQRVTGTVSGTTGFNTYLLLLDYRGAVADLSKRTTKTGDSETFAFRLPVSAGPAKPMAIVSIASKEPIEGASFQLDQVAKVIFPVIRRAIEAMNKPVSVNVRYFKLGAP